MKKALLIGINYVGTNSKLNSCINDIYSMKNYLETNLNYNNITLLTDYTNDKPTTANIYKELYNLLADSMVNNLEEVWIHYSGHGTSIINYSGDEKDEKDERDECIVPVDYKYSGIISNDNIRHYFQYFSPNTKVYTFFDCCNSGTIANLPYSYLPNDFNPNQKHNILSNNIILISGCRDDKYSVNAYNINKDYKYSGAMTSCLLLVLQNNNTLTYRDLIIKLNNELNIRGFTQRPQLSSTKKLTNDSVFITKIDNVSNLFI
jgi:hypothetical protein